MVSLVEGGVPLALTLAFVLARRAQHATGLGLVAAQNTTIAGEIRSPQVREDQEVGSLVSLCEAKLFVRELLTPEPLNPLGETGPAACR